MSDDADPYLNKAVAQKFHELLPGSELFLVSSARHFVQMDEPEQVGRLILDMARKERPGLTLVTNRPPNQC
jgi:pimeloyl-ACP methyl ester carboxylesterase